MKQAIIVPRWLKMSPGKVASQCCHAALKFGQFDDRRVVLAADSPAHIKAIEKLVSRAIAAGGGYSSLQFGFFMDSGPTTEGTENVITVYSIRGSEAEVNYITEDMELY